MFISYVGANLTWGTQEKAKLKEEDNKASNEVCAHIDTNKNIRKQEIKVRN